MSTLIRASGFHVSKRMRFTRGIKYKRTSVHGTKKRDFLMKPAFEYPQFWMSTESQILPAVFCAESSQINRNSKSHPASNQRSNGNVSCIIFKTRLSVQDPCAARVIGLRACEGFLNSWKLSSCGKHARPIYFSHVERPRYVSVDFLSSPEAEYLSSASHIKHTLSQTWIDSKPGTLVWDPDSTKCDAG